MESAEACEHMMGSVVKARVQSVDLAKKRIELSLRLSKPAAAPAAPAAGDIPALGSVVSCAVELLSTTPSDADQAPFAVVRIVDAAGKTRCQGTLSQVQCGDLVDDARARFAALKPSKRLMYVSLRDEHSSDQVAYCTDVLNTYWPTLTCSGTCSSSNTSGLARTVGTQWPCQSSRRS